jgi:hypothetical protein
MKEDVLKANQSFYKAFANGDHEAMDALWARNHAVSVIHPGWGGLHGRNAVMDSWRRILEGNNNNDIQCEQPVVFLAHDLAYVTCHEVFPDGQLIATNIFIWEDKTWRMVHHQAGPVNQPGNTSGQTSIH